MASGRGSSLTDAQVTTILQAPKGRSVIELARDMNAELGPLFRARRRATQQARRIAHRLGLPPLAKRPRRPEFTVRQAMEELENELG